MSAAGKPRHIPVREDWLALRTEDAIEPERPIIDAHHHLWDKPGSRYLLDEMLDDIGGHTIVATIFAEGKCHYRTDGPEELRPLGETELVTAIADEAMRRGAATPQIAAAIIGFVDLSLGERVGQLVDAHLAAAPGRFRGVRYSSAWHADPEARGSVLVQPPGILYDHGVGLGLEALAQRSLVFDAWMYHTQLGDLADLAHDHPRLSIVLNHVGGPIGIGPYADRREAVGEDWRHFMRRLARYDNVAVKLGGFGMLMSGFDFHERDLPPASDDLAAAWGPYMRDAIDIFGPERCMFESNFPVDKGTASYRVLWNAFKKIASGRAEAYKDALFFGTAQRVYGLTCVDRQGKTEPQAVDAG